MADRHEGHDLLLVAAHAASDLDGDDAARADALVATCRDCATLATDLRAIARATAEVPPVPRTRDFFIQPADAERLRPRGFRRIAAAFSAPSLRLARPLAGGLMMVGFVGLLVASLPGLGGSAALAPTDQRLESVASSAPGSEIQGEGEGDAAASVMPFATDAFAGASGGGAQASAPPRAAAQPSAAPTHPAPLPIERDTVTAERPSALFVGSLGLVAIGAALFLFTLLRTAPRPS